MKKTSGWFFLAVAMGALMMLGCAQAGGAKPETAANQSTPAPTTGAAVSNAVIPEENGKPVVKADSKESFEAVVAAIHQQMQPGGRWQYMDANDRATVDGSFADMGKLYDQYGSMDKMDQAAKTRLLADQSTVNAILDQNDGNRLICRNELPIGSHLPVKTCKTYAQIQAEQRGVQERMLNQREAGH